MIEDHSITSSSSRLSISAVNQRWRKAAHSLRSLWTRLDIIIRMPTYTDGWDTTDKRINHFSSGSVNLFRRHEELTHGAPLYITLILAGKDGDGATSPGVSLCTLLDAIFATMGRWKSFCYLSYGAKMPTPIYKFLTMPTLSILEELSVHSSDAYFEPSLVLGAMIPVVRMDTNIVNMGSTGLSQLHSLTLYHQVHPQTGDALHFLRQLVVLHTLRLSTLTREMWGGVGDAIVELPSVKHLVWGTGNEAEWIERMVLPELVTFELQNMDYLPNVRPLVPRPDSRYAASRYKDKECMTLNRLLQSGRLGRPSMVIVRDWMRRNDIVNIIKAYHCDIEGLGIIADDTNGSRISEVSVSSSCRVFPQLRSLHYPLGAADDIVANNEKVWQSRESKLESEEGETDALGIAFSLIWQTTRELGI